MIWDTELGVKLEFPLPRLLLDEGKASCFVYLLPSSPRLPWVPGSQEFTAD